VQRDITVSYFVEQDENGTWTAEAALDPKSFANGEGATREAAIEDLKDAIVVLAETVGVPEQLTVTVEDEG
jgi:predicted RNase H-like HicB family nuclease